MITVAVAIVRAWTLLYTCIMPAPVRDRRRAEIDSDLWEFQQDVATTRGVTPAMQMLLRLVAGLPDDLAWCIEHVADAEVAPGRTIVLIARTIGAALFIAVLLTIAGDASRRRTGFVFDPPEAREGRQTLLMAGIVATVGPTMAATDEFEVASIKPNRSGSGLLRMRFATMGAPWLNPCPAPSSLRPSEPAELILLNGLSPHLALCKAACKSPPVRPLEHG